MTIPEIIRRIDVLCAAAGILPDATFVERLHKRYYRDGSISETAIEWRVSVVCGERAASGYGRRPSDALRDLRTKLTDPECPLRPPPPQEATL